MMVLDNNGHKNKAEERSGDDIKIGMSWEEIEQDSGEGCC